MLCNKLRLKLFSKKAKSKALQKENWGQKTQKETYGKVLQKESWGQGQGAAGRKFRIRGFNRKTEARVLQKLKLRLWRFRMKFEAKVFLNEIWDQAASKKRIRGFRKKAEVKALRRESWDLETSVAKLRRRFKKERWSHGALERRLSLRCVRKTSTEKAYGLVHPVTVLTTR